ncbi:MAG: efflux RND transporter periplasmic adaptor subunit [Rickettsiales bacterium]|jgi:HlyD family secretion protein|nr:efflux RND transporter periplasmic adaptor subunit [Rickettsiales bacterium]
MIFKDKRVIVSLLVIVGVICFFTFRTNNIKFNLKDFDVEEIKRSDLLKNVTANGTINPVSVVAVGSQVSGIIEKIFVDFNFPVTKNQLLARLDTSVLERTVSERQEAKSKSEKKLAFAKSQYNKNLVMYQDNYIAKVELEQSDVELKSAEADYKIASSQLDTAKINLGYAFIRSPVAGVIVSREVDEGQTVAAGFSTPTLFKVAEDLTKMQIETSISEADIGSIKNGLEVEFSVDAHPGDKFIGNIQQIRLNPTTDSNVVVYKVIVSTTNNDKKLMPGMTAYVNIPIGEAKNVLNVSNVALRFNPDDDLLKIMGVERLNRQEGYSIVYKIDNENKIRPIYVKRGINNLSRIEISSDELRDGDKIIINSVFVKNKK